jgi:hypothetical protein
LDLLSISFTPGNREDIPAQLPDIFSEGEAAGFSLIQELLRFFLLRRILYFEDNSITVRDIGLGPGFATAHYKLNDQVDGRKRYRWNPYTANRPQERFIRSNFVASVVGKFFELDLMNNAKSIDEQLDVIWECLRKTVLKPTDFGGEYQLDAGRIIVSTKYQWYACNRCGRLTTFDLKGQCAAPGCIGQVLRYDDQKIAEKFAQHHYRYRTLESEPFALEVVEHTAQLTNKQGAKYQKSFIKGEINVLSSSTTFEMGVDVGALKAVLLRNVPPTASNYIQRAGRAGRRRDGVAYAVSYSRSTPHDQFHFHEPTRIVSGKVAVPQINLNNSRLAQRHINSTLLSQYLKSLPGVQAKISVAEFFLNPQPENSFAAGFRNFIEAERPRLLTIVQNILPRETKLDSEESLEIAWRMLLSSDSDCVFEREVKEPLCAYENQIAELRAQQDGANPGLLIKLAKAQQSVQLLIDQLKTQRLIDFLAGAHWLPSYAFPQDVIRLVVRQANWSEKMRLERALDVGISEYAPGAEIIADGHLFKSRGVLRRGQTFEVRKYRFCQSCRTLKTASGLGRIEAVCGCGTRSQEFNYIRPQGFQTFFDDPVVEPNLYRLRPPANTEIFLVAGVQPEEFKPHSALPGVTYGYRKDGRLFRANPGFQFKQFLLCQSCGRHFEERPKAAQSHPTPWGTRCQGTIFKTHLAHEFETDTLQLRFDSCALAPPDVADHQFWLSFQTAFAAAAAEALSIPRSDLEGTYRSQSSDSLCGELIVYDRVPGGAGYVELIIEHLPKILRYTLERVEQCPNALCDPTGSCYACLRSYENQFVWDRLSRESVAEWLKKIVH